ncbi:MAG TPA: thiamine phosphate synthase [Candidatus Brocadiales bacterium]|nr:thiamine phosphate synthase [Candidatus Brocadiales bacterium]
MQYQIKGLYVITDEKLIPRNRFVETVEKAIKGGAKIVQLREKKSSRDEILRLAGELLKLTRRYNVPLIINDYLELARDVGAEGVHLGQHDTSLAEARKVLGNRAIIGVSCYSSIERGIEAHEEGADYLAFGTPFFTPTKPDRQPTSFEILKEARRVIPKIPIFAIGGITPQNVASILETGVDGIAVITSVFGSSDPEKVSRQLSAFFEDII